MRMTRLLSLTVSCTAAIVALLSTGGSAQQKVPFRGDTPIAPSGIPRIPLPDQPVIYDTAEGPADSRRGAREWPVASVEPGVPSRWRHARDGTGRSPAAHSQWRPRPESQSRGCLLIRTRRPVRSDGRVLHPQFATNGFVYLSYAKPLNEKGDGDGDRARQVERHGADRGPRRLRRSCRCRRRRAHGVRA